MIESMSSLSATAYVAGISERDVNRIFDESLLPEEAIHSSRILTPLGCVMASFYFHEAGNLTADFRKKVVHLLGRRRSAMPKTKGFDSPPSAEWDIEMGSLLVRLGHHVQETASRMDSLARAEYLIESDPALFDGEPVFKNTRVPVRTIAAWLDEGIDRERLRETYPHVTDEMLAAAPIWVKTHPTRGRPRKFGEINPDWRVGSSSKRKLGGE